MDQTQRADDDPAERAAADYFARKASGETEDPAEYLKRLAEEHHARFRELVEQGDLAFGVMPEPGERHRVLSGRYRLEKEIGQGGMGRVFAAFDVQLQRKVAIKVLTALDVGDPEREAFLLKESRILAGLQHPNIVSVHETGRDDDLFYVVMDLVDGESMATVIERIAGRLERNVDGQDVSTRPIKDSDLIREAIRRPVLDGRRDYIDPRSYSRSVASIVLEVVRTIEAAHAATVIHRDIKPSNIMLTGGGNPVVLDFGLAGSTDRVAGAITEGLYGTVAYIAPEQARSQRVGSDRRTDIYQLGLLLYEFLTLTRAFPHGAIVDVLERIQRGDFPLPRALNPAIPSDLEAICLKALEVSNTRRYQDVRELREDLTCFLSGDGIPIAVKHNFARGMLRKTRIAVRRRPATAAMTGMLLVGLTGWVGARAFAQEPFDPKILGVAIEGPGLFRAVSANALLRPTERSLGIQVQTTEECVIFALSQFKDDADDPDPFLRPVEPTLLGRETSRVGRWGLLVPAGSALVECANVAGSEAAREGMVVYAAAVDGRAMKSDLFNDWLTYLDENGSENFPIVKSDAYRILKDMKSGEATRGISPPPLTDEEERAAWAAVSDVEDPNDLGWKELGTKVFEVECRWKDSGR